MPKELSAILRYTQILRSEGLKSVAARNFYKEHMADKVFVRRAEVLHKMDQAKTVPSGTVKAAN